MKQLVQYSAKEIAEIERQIEANVDFLDEENPSVPFTIIKPVARGSGLQCRLHFRSDSQAIFLIAYGESTSEDQGAMDKIILAASEPFGEGSIDGFYSSNPYRILSYYEA